MHLLFSDPYCFTSSDIQTAVHYLYNKLTGTLWLDNYDNGKCGDPDDDINDAIGEQLRHRRRIGLTRGLRHRRATAR